MSIDCVDKENTNSQLPDFISFDTKAPSNLRTDWGTTAKKFDNVPQVPSNLKSSWGDKGTSSFLSSNINSTVPSFTAKSNNTTLTSATSASLKNWDLPTDLTRAYAVKEVASNSSTNSVDISRTNNIEEDDAEKESLGVLNEHLPKYSEAEHNTLLEIALREAEQKSKDLLQKRVNEWELEKEKLKNDLNMLRDEHSTQQASYKQSNVELTTVNEELLLMKMQTKALTHRLQVHLACLHPYYQSLTRFICIL